MVGLGGARMFGKEKPTIPCSSQGKGGRLGAGGGEAQWLAELKPVPLKNSPCQSIYTLPMCF